MDGSAINGFITGGGVIRNYQGQAIFFFFFLSSGKNMQAEARALITGLDLASQLGIPLSCMELDAQVLLHFIHTGSSPWNLVYLTRSCKSLLSPSCNLSRILREGNKVADSLASFAHAHRGSMVFYSEEKFPTCCKSHLLHDALGLYSFRPS